MSSTWNKTHPLPSCFSNKSGWSSQ